MIRIFPSVEMRRVTSPWKTSSGVFLKLIFAAPVMTIGALNAASQPFIDGFALIRRYCCSTCCLTVESQFAAVVFVGAAKALLRRSNGLSIEGSVEKNSTPAVKLVIWKTGGNGMAAGIAAVVSSPSRAGL